ncbi:MAG: hypothetical protein JXR81_01660 [Candidatus Goldbacteria bacterium]|nr:hypothetical protein [Candidatus Goldiibacteriota bacterium]
MGKKRPGVKPELQEDVKKIIEKITKSPEAASNMPKTMLKKEEWGLLTILNLLLASVFPAYFVNILLISFFTELGHLWTTHLSELEREKLVNFEKEFRKGYEMEGRKQYAKAAAIYDSLAVKYSKDTRIAEIASQRALLLREKRKRNKKK